MNEVSDHLLRSELRRLKLELSDVLTGISTATEAVGRENADSNEVKALLALCQEKVNSLLGEFDHRLQEPS